MRLRKPRITPKMRLEALKKESELADRDMHNVTAYLWTIKQ